MNGSRVIAFNTRSASGSVRALSDPCPLSASARISAYQNIRIVVNDQDVARCANHSVEEFHQERRLPAMGMEHIAQRFDRSAVVINEEDACAQTTGSWR